MVQLVLNCLRRVFKVRVDCKLCISRGCIFRGFLHGILLQYICSDLYMPTIEMVLLYLVRKVLLIKEHKLIILVYVVFYN